MSGNIADAPRCGKVSLPLAARSLPARPAAGVPIAPCLGGRVLFRGPVALFVDGVQQGLHVAELGLMFQGRVQQAAGVGLRVAQGQSTWNVSSITFGWTPSLYGSSRATSRANLGILRRSLAMIRSAMAGPMPGRVDSPLASCSSIGGGHVLDRPDHGPQRLLHAHAVDRAEQLEELPLDLAQKPDQPRRQPALCWVAFQVVDRVQADRLRPARCCSCRRVNSGISTSYSKASDAKVAASVVRQGSQVAGDFGDHDG